MPNLRVLKLSDWWLRDLPQAITDLEELTYLSSAGIKYSSSQSINVDILDVGCSITLRNSISVQLIGLQQKLGY